MQSKGRGASGMDAYYNAEYGRRSLWVALVRAGRTVPCRTAALEAPT